MKCPNCGNENPPDYVFCDECGARLQGGDGADVAAEQGFDAGPSMTLQGQPSGMASSAPAGAQEPVFSGYGSSGGLGQTEGNGSGDASGQEGGYTPYMSTATGTGATGAGIPTGSQSAPAYGSDAAGNSTGYGGYSARAESVPMGAGTGGGVGMGMAGIADTGGTGGATTGYGSWDQGQSAGAQASSPDYAAAGQSTQVYSAGNAGNQAGEQAPVTEDTMQAYSGSDQPDNAGGAGLYGMGGSEDSGQSNMASAPLPGVTSIDDSNEGTDSSDSAASMVYAPADSMAATDTSSSAETESADTGMSAGMGTSAGTAESSATAMTPQSGTGTGQSAGGDWSGQAIQHLDNAQQALGSGDWEGFGRHMSQLRSYLSGAGSSAGGANSVAAQLAGMSADTSGTSQEQAPAYTPAAASSQDAESSVYSSPAHGAAQSASQGTDSAAQGTGGAEGATLEPEAEAGTLGSDASQAPAYPDYSSSYGGYSSPDQGASSIPAGAQQGASAGAVTEDPLDILGAASAPVASGTGAGSTNGAVNNTMARLVIISTGAELPLPDQEEITVGREDPSSGIFPDVDLTPYGGEEGGVSRRHARMLKTNNEFFVEDLQSTNFTKLDGQRLPAHVRERLEDGARIDFGRVATIFRRS